MKCHIPQISWHNRDPVLSIDFQMCQDNIRRLATAGTDAHILIWYVTLNSNGSTSLEFASDLNRHTKTVNIVRFSPNGEMLASGDDEASIIIWKPQKEKDIIMFDEDMQNKENWTVLKVLRGHLDDVCDISWSPNSLFLVSGSVDNTAISWDVQKGKKIELMTDSKGFVQGVTWDPLQHYIVILSSDRAMRVYNIHSKRVLYKVQKASIPYSTDKDRVPSKSVRLFYDDTLKSFCRRLTFSPDGELLIAPSGILEKDDGKFLNTTYVFSRHSLNKPVMHLPTADKYTVAVRFCPVYFELVPKELEGVDQDENSKPWLKHKSVWSLPYRMVFAVATKDSIILYDTQHTLPLAHVNNIHYTHLTDISWSHDGRCLIASSTDGYCSFITFAEGELGTPYSGKIASRLVEIIPKEKRKSSFETKSCPSDPPIIEEKSKENVKNLSPSHAKGIHPFVTPKKEKRLEDFWKNVKKGKSKDNNDREIEEEPDWKLSLEASNSSPPIRPLQSTQQSNIFDQNVDISAKSSSSKRENETLPLKSSNNMTVKRIKPTPCNVQNCSSPEIKIICEKISNCVKPTHSSVFDQKDDKSVRLKSSIKSLFHQVKPKQSIIFDQSVTKDERIKALLMKSSDSPVKCIKYTQLKPSHPDLEILPVSLGSIPSVDCLKVLSRKSVSEDSSKHEEIDLSDNKVIKTVKSSSNSPPKKRLRPTQIGNHKKSPISDKILSESFSDNCKKTIVMQNNVFDQSLVTQSQTKTLTSKNILTNSPSNCQVAQMGTKKSGRRIQFVTLSAPRKKE